MSNSSFGEAYAREVEALLGELRLWAGSIDTSSLGKAPAPGEWSVVQNLAHVAEFLRYWTGQALFVAGHPNSPFGRGEDDPDRIGAVTAHADDDPVEAMSAIDASAIWLRERITSLPLDAWDVIGLHPRFGEMDIREIMERFVVRHLAGHIEQVKATAPPQS
jgi:hypothetical protein